MVADMPRWVFRDFYLSFQNDYFTDSSGFFMRAIHEQCANGTTQSSMGHSPMNFAPTLKPALKGQHNLPFCMDPSGQNPSLVSFPWAPPRATLYCTLTLLSVLAFVPHASLRVSAPLCVLLFGVFGFECSNGFLLHKILRRTILLLSCTTRRPV